MCLAWKIYWELLVVMLTMKAYLSKLFSYLFLLRALAPLQIPASLCEGPIYLFLLLSHHLLIKAPVGDHYCHLYDLFLIDVEYDLTGSLLP